MQAAILCLAIVAYGDTSDYIPPAAAQTAKPARQHATDFMSTASKPARSFRDDARQRQQRLDQEFKTGSTTLPKPFHRGTVAAAAGYDARSSKSAVIRAQHQMEDSWPNRPIDGTGYGKNTAATDPTDVDAHRPFSLSTPRMNEPTTPVIRSAGRGKATTRSRSRYIPPNSTTAPPADDAFAVPPRTRRRSSTVDDSRARTPRFIANEPSELRIGSDRSTTSGGDFKLGGTTQQTRQFREQPASRDTGSDFDLRDFDRRLGTQETTPPAVTTTPPYVRPNTSDPQVGTRQRGETYLPPNSDYRRPSQQSASTPRVVAPTQTWPSVAQTVPTERRDRTILPNTPVTEYRRPAAQPGTTFPPQSVGIASTRVPATTAAGPGMRRINYTDPTVQGGSYFMTLLMLFGSIGLNLYLGWIAWDTYNRYQDMVADIRYSSPRRESLRDEFVERVA